MFSGIKKWLIGRPKKTRELSEERLTKLKALPILSSDALSSVAYGYEAILGEIAILGVAGLWIGIPVALVIVILLITLVLSYLQVIQAYPEGGGAYAVAKDQFGPVAGLVAGSALLVDYTMTVAVSVSSGVAAITSVLPMLLPNKVLIAVCCILLIMLINLRGIRESGSVFMWPTYAFIASIFVVESLGFFHLFTHGGHFIHTPPIFQVPNGLTLFLILRAFASGCSALTGVEAISNATPQFREPEIKNARITLAILGVILAVMFLGTGYLMFATGIQVRPNETVLSQLVTAFLGHSWLYYFVQTATFAVLILAANTSYSGFPLLAALMSQDKFMPRQFAVRGDRLGYSNGIIVLSSLAIVLIIAFHADTGSLIPLYAIGVFLSFTLGQSGMVKRWLTTKPEGWQGRTLINGLGALLSFIVTVVFAIAKFTQGAWIVLIVLPMIISWALRIRRHYRIIERELQMDRDTTKPVNYETIVVVPVGGVNRIVANTISYAKSISDNVLAVYVAFSDEAIEEMEQKWVEWDPGVRLSCLKSQYRSVLKPLERFLSSIEFHQKAPEHITVVVGQLVMKHWWENILHNQTSVLLRTRFLFRKEVVITTVPYHLHG